MATWANYGISPVRYSAATWTLIGHRPFGTLATRRSPQQSFKAINQGVKLVTTLLDWVDRPIFQSGSRHSALSKATALTQ